MQQTTSILITNYLLDNPPTSVKELSEKLNLTKADIRYHIKKLLNSGVITPTHFEPGLTRGRPAAKFTLVEDNLPNNLLEIIHTFFEIHDDDPTIFSILGNALADKMEIPSDKNLLNKLNRILPKLNARNYKSRWETHSTGPVIFFYNCPYRVLLDKYPQLCRMDEMILTKLLQKQVVQTHNCFDLHSKACRFQIRYLQV